MEWKTGTIKEFAEVKGGKRLPKGKALMSIQNSHPYIRIRDLGKSKFLQLDSEYEYVDDETQKEISRYIVHEGDILISVVGTVGLVGIVDKSLDGANQTENCDKLTNLHGIDRDYIYYYLISKYGQDEIKKGTVGAVQPKLPLKNIQDLPIHYPPFEVQRKIGAILSDLDSKIETNNRINGNLSEQLRCVFEEMFITNAENNWPEKKLGDFLDLERGLSYKGKFLAENEGVPMLNLGNILPNSVFRPEKLKYYTGEYKERHIVKPGDIIVANTDLTQAREVLGSAIRVPDLGYENVICSHHISIVRNSKISNNFILGLLNMPAYRTRVAGFATGTTVLALPNDTILNCEFQCPTEEVLAKYDEIAEPIYAQMEEIRRENDQLALLRDSLLPKLMSGEIDVSEVEL